MSLVHLQPTLHPVEREVICAALEDSVDQLAVLGGIMGPKFAAVDNVSVYVWNAYICVQNIAVLGWFLPD